MTQPPLPIGAHTSAAGGAHKALLHGESIGATTIQFFTSNQRQWKSGPIPDSEVEKFLDLKKKLQMDEIMSHDSYLINLGSPDSHILEKSLAAFKAEIQRCHQLQIKYLNFHPGAATKSSKESCIHQIIASLKQMAPLCREGNTRLLLETTAGQGTTVGNLFSELHRIIEAVKDDLPIGVCIDTCHIFAAGYDIRTPAAWEETLQEFDRVIGLEHLYAFHVNDSLKPFDSRRDRHACLGEGEIGIDSFRFMMQDPRIQKLPKYLETPEPERWKDEIQRLRDFAYETH